MNGVYFGNIHSFYDLNLILAPFTPTPAEPKLNFLEIPGRDGHLDLTEANGEVKYNSREFEFIFTVAPGDPLTFDERVSAVSNALNGLRCKITLDRDPDYYWEGRCAVSEYDQDKNIGQIVVTATVNPYKLKQNPTVVSATIEHSGILKWDGNTAGKIYVSGYDWHGYRISDATPTAADCNTGGIVYWIYNGEEYTAPFSKLSDIGRQLDNGIILLVLGAFQVIVIVPEDGLTWMDVTFPKKGLYSPCHGFGYMSELAINDFNGFGNTMLSLENGRKSATPSIECSSAMTITVGDSGVTLDEGFHKDVVEIRLKQGMNEVKVTGIGTITITYQQGEL